MFSRSPPLIWAGGAFAAGPGNPGGAPLALHVADQAVRLSRGVALHNYDDANNRLPPAKINSGSYTLPANPPAG